MTNTKEELRRMMQGIRYDLELAFEGGLKNEDWEPVDLWEYLADGLTLDYRVGPDKSPTACRVWFTLGGPNIWVDTETDSIHGAWGSDREEGNKSARYFLMVNIPFQQQFQSNVISSKIASDSSELI